MLYIIKQYVYNYITFILYIAVFTNYVHIAQGSLS